MSPADADRGADPALVGRLEAGIRQQLERVLPARSLGNSRVDFGMGLDCGACGWRDDGSGGRLTARLIEETSRSAAIAASIRIFKKSGVPQ